MKKYLIKLLPYDKSLHLLGGMIVFLIANSVLVGGWSLLVVLIAAISVEVIDYVSKKGTPEIMDIIYTIAGGLLALILTI